MATISFIRGTKVEMEIFEQDSMQFEFAFLEDDKVTPVDIMDWTFVMHFKKRDCNCWTIQDKTELIKTLGDGLTLSYINTLLGDFKADLIPGKFKFDLVATDENGAVTTWLFGSTSVEDKV